MVNPNIDLKFLKGLFWLYFLLLIFEGALRKWILPELANPLLLVRDPVVILMYAVAMAQGVFPDDALVVISFILGLLCLAAGLMVDTNELTVALYGWRANFLHLPLIYLIPKIFTREDVIRMGKYTLWISVPMAILVVVQFISPTSSWINMSVGGGEGNMMAGGHVRPPGTFSFTTGMVSFSGLSSCFIFWTLTETKTYSRLLTILGLLALVISLSVSGSRSAVIEVAVSFVAMLWVWSHQGKLMANVIILLPAVLLAFFLLSYFSFVGSGIEVLSDRFSEGGAAGIFGRVLSGFFAPLQYIDTVPLLGYGLGVGTSAGAVLRTGNRDFLLAEGEWSRVVLESGLILGFSYLFLRVAIVVQLLNRAAKAISENNSLAPILCVLGAVHILVDQFGQTTALGFCVIIAGLGFAALNQPIALPVVVAPASWTPGMITPRNDAMPVFAKAISGVPLPRGRSNYSRRLHGPQSPPRT